MAVRLNSRPVDIARARLLTGRRPRGSQPAREDGSLILDILIGMAIFALIAIIAVSAIGQYRARAYIQAAVSDAEQIAHALNAFITDQATKSSDGAAGEPPFPTGVLSTGMLAVLDVTPTGSGPTASVVSVSPSAVSAEDFEVCVEHRSGYAIYSSAHGGLVESGNSERDGFGGCATPAPTPTPTNQADCAAIGWAWYPASPEQSIATNDAPLYSYAFEDTDTRTYSLPWEVGYSQADYESTLNESTVRINWWPTSPAEEAEFSIEQDGDGSAWLARNGTRVTYDVMQGALPGRCEQPF